MMVPGTRISALNACGLTTIVLTANGPVFPDEPDVFCSEPACLHAAAASIVRQ
jgi:hypothetical protein